MSVTALAGFLADFLVVALASPAFAWPVSCGTGVLVPVLAVGGGGVCADAFSTLAMASRAVAHATANGRKRICARDPCNAQREFMMDALPGGGPRRRRQAELARGTCCAWARYAPGMPANVAEPTVPLSATGKRSYAPPMNNGDKTPRAMWRL